LKEGIQARKWANNYVKKNITKLDSLISGKSGTYFQTELIIEELGSLNAQSFYEIDETAAVTLLKKANTDFFALRAIKIIISQNLKMRKKIPECWNDLHASIVKGTNNKPIKSTRRETKDWRNFIARIMAFYLIEKFKITLSSNPLSKRGESAVEIITEVLNTNKLIPITESSAIEQGIRRLPSFYITDIS